MNAPVTIDQLDRPAPRFRHFSVEPITPAIGAIVHGLHLADLNEASGAELREALWHYGVLFAREQHLSFEQQKRVARHFGDELERHTFGRTMADQGHPEVLIIQKSKSAGNGTTTDV